jgi:hypothetical protein
VSISNPWNKIGVVYIGPLIPPKRWQILKLIKTILLAFMASFFSFGKSNAQTSKVFKEPLNTAVFTTQYVIEENKGITYVTHDADDGAWQFFSDDKFEDFEKVAKVVGLGEIIERDKSILELADMPVGYYAYRKSVKDKWIIRKQGD